MKTVFLTASPKKHHKWSNSAYVAHLTGAVCKEREFLHLGGPKDYASIQQKCAAADAVVFAMPLYVDSIAAHFIEFLQATEDCAKNWNCKIYVISCCGFYEGEQTHIQLEQIRHWCSHTGLPYGGGLGIGATEMIGTIRFTNLFACIPLGLLVGMITALCSGSMHSGIVSGAISFIISLLLYLLWSSGVFWNAFLFGRGIQKKETMGNRYTSLWFCGRWLFTIFASIFWIIRAAKNKVSLFRMWKRITLASAE